ncbi:hypothetical protein [Paenibacillus elgii]
MELIDVSGFGAIAAVAASLLTFISYRLDRKAVSGYKAVVN